MTLSEELQWRGFVNQTTFPDITALDKDPLTFYWGVDPSAPSMTIGNLAAAMMVRHFINYGHRAILLVGGATGMIGDPDGKADERNLKSEEEIQNNKNGITEQYRQLFDGKDFTIVDNFDWFKDMGYLHFLRQVGKHVPMRQMLNREFIQTRLGDAGSGISYAEFSYVLIQAYDYLRLHQDKGVTLQVCGSDQWGNCIAGVDLIRRITGNDAHVWSAPLVINKITGKKFGKSEDGAVWLDPSLTTPYQFYQFWLNVDDEGVADYIKLYTLLSKETIEQILSRFNEDRASRVAQKTLAYEVTKLVHGQLQADLVKTATEKSFGGDTANMSPEEFEIIAVGTKRAQGAVQPLTEIITENGLAASKSEARQLLRSGAVSINGHKIVEETSQLTSDLTVQGYALIRIGKNKQLVFQLIDAQ